MKAMRLISGSSVYAVMVLKSSTYMFNWFRSSNDRGFHPQGKKYHFLIKPFVQKLWMNVPKQKNWEKCVWKKSQLNKSWIDFFTLSGLLIKALRWKFSQPGARPGGAIFYPDNLIMATTIMNRNFYTE